MLDGNKLLLVNHYGPLQSRFLGSSWRRGRIWTIHGPESGKGIRGRNGIAIQTGEFQFLFEFIYPPLHAIELYFNVVVRAGSPINGIDPEMGSKPQIIREVKFLSENEILKILKIISMESSGSLKAWRKSGG